MVCAAAVAGTVAGLSGLSREGLVVLPHQIFVGDAVVHVAPRGHFVQTDSALAVELGVNAHVLEDLHPGVVLEALFPAVKIAAALVGLEDDGSQAAVALGKDALEEAGGAVVVVDLDFAAVDAFEQVLLLGLQHLFGIHRDELERGVGLRHEAGAADGHLHAAALGVLGIGVEQIDHFLSGLGDALDVLHRLGGKAHHEVELDGGVAVGKGQRAGLFDFVPGDVLIDDVAQALGPGLSGKGQAALAHLGGFFNEALGEVVHSQRGQRQADVLFRRPLVQIVQQLFELAVVRGGQAGKAQLLVAGVGAEVLCGLVQQAGVALAHGAVEEACLTEPTAAHTAAQHLDAGAVLDGTHHRDDEVGRGRKVVQVLDDGLGDDCRDARLVGSDGLNAAIVVVFDVVESRDIDAGDPGNAEQQLFLGDAALFLGLFDFGADAGQLVFALAQLDDVEEVGDGLGVAGTGAARHDEGPALVTVFRVERDARQIQHGEDVGVGQLILKRKAHSVESREGVFALHRVEGQAQALHLSLHIQPRHKGALTPPVFVAVQQLVEDFFAQKGHAHFVGVRETEREADVYLIFIFIHAARFAAGITARLLHPGQRFFQFRIKHQVPPFNNTDCIFIYFTLFGRRLQQTSQHLSSIQRWDRQKVERPGEQIGRKERTAPDGCTLLHPHCPDGGQEAIHARPGGSEQKGLSPGEGLTPGPHTETGHGHFDDGKSPKQEQIDEDMPHFVEDSGAQTDAQEAAGVEPEQQIQRPAEQQRVTEHQRPQPDEPPHGRPSRAPAS